MARKFAASSALALALAFGGLAQAQPNGPPPGPPAADPQTQAFIAKAAQGDEFERREGRLAAARSANPAVRAFAERMIVDHTRTTRALRGAIEAAGLPLPPPPVLDPDQMHMIADLRATPSPGFDRVYVAQQVQAHQMALSLMQGYAANGPTGPIRRAAAKTTPLVEQHLHMLSALQAKGV